MYWPKMALMTAGGGWSDANLVKNLGKTPMASMSPPTGLPKVNLPGGSDINVKFKAKYGLDMIGGTNTSYAVHLLAAALEKSCSRDPKALANVLRTTDFKTGKWNFMFPEESSSIPPAMLKSPGPHRPDPERRTDDRLAGQTRPRQGDLARARMEGS